MVRSNKTFTPGRGYTRDDWEVVSDNPELTAEDLAKALPLAEVFPELAASIANNGATIQGSRPVSVRLSGVVVETYKATGPGWQARIDADLRRLNKIK